MYLALDEPCSTALGFLKLAQGHPVWVSCLREVRVLLVPTQEASMDSSTPAKAGRLSLPSSTCALGADRVWERFGTELS